MFLPDDSFHPSLRYATVLTGSAYSAGDFDPGLCHPEKGPMPSKSRVRSTGWMPMGRGVSSSSFLGTRKYGGFLAPGKSHRSNWMIWGYPYDSGKLHFSVINDELMTRSY